MSISENLKLYRSINNMSQQEVAEKSGITRNGYRNIEKGITEPKTRTLMNIAKVFDVKVEDLVKPKRKLTKVKMCWR